MPQSQVSVVMTPGPKARRVTAHEVFVRIADGLDMPDEPRRRLGLAPADGSSTVTVVGLDHRAAIVADRPNDAEDQDAVRRRELFEVAGAAVVGVALGDTIPRPARLAGFAEVLTQYSPVRPSGAWKLGLRELRTALNSTRQRYQACEYDTLARSLPRLLTEYQVAGGETEGDELRQIQGLAADAYHVAAGVLLKFDDHGLASLAADRSIRAAHDSDDPITIAASARILTHTLARDGHAAPAEQLVSDAAVQLSRTVTTPTPDSLSVYGALLLRGAVAAVNRGDRATALTLLDEADEAGRQLGVDGNYRWTAFGPTNVLLHRINVCTVLGDAGTAIEYARCVDLTRIPVPERQAMLYIDVARAYNMWGRYEQAYHAIRQAETIAPEEIRSRPAVHRLVGDLVVRSPRSLHPQIREYASGLGVEL